MASTKQKRRQRKPRQLVQNADLFCRNTGASGYVPTVDPNHLNQKIWDQLLEKNEAHLTRISKNSVLLLGTQQPRLIAVGQRTGLSTDYHQEGSNCVVISDITVLDRTTAFTSSAVNDGMFLLVPNTRMHVFLAAFLSERSDYFGTLDRCTNDCPRCPISAVCLPGLTPFSLGVTVENCQRSREKGGVRYAGEKIDRWPFYLGQASRHPTWVTSILMKRFLRTIYCEGGFDVFLNGKNGFSIELQKVQACPNKS